MSSVESRLKPNHEVQCGSGAGVVLPAGSESKQGPNATTPSQAETLLAAGKRTLEMIASSASLLEVLNDLCGSIDAHAPLLPRSFFCWIWTGNNCWRVPVLVFPPHLPRPSPLDHYSSAKMAMNAWGKTLQAVRRGRERMSSHGFQKALQ
jgi:hypothetical protein